jgi:hypothetical protein
LETQKIDAHKITKPMQLMAVWFIALLLIDSAFLTAAAKIVNPPWICPMLSIAAVVFVPLFISCVLLMQTVFRKELQEDQYYSEWLKIQGKTFRYFKPENVSNTLGGQINDSSNITAASGISLATGTDNPLELLNDNVAPSHNKGHDKGKSGERGDLFGEIGQEGSGGSTLLFGPYYDLTVNSVQEDDLEKVREAICIKNKCIFLVHSWRPSLIQEQVVDVVIWLHQHHEGPLSHGEVEKVEYQLGPKFFKQPKIKTNASESFRLDVSAYGPMLCLARVYIKGEDTPLLLERYINFEEALSNSLHKKSS